MNDHLTLAPEALDSAAHATHATPARKPAVIAAVAALATAVLAGVPVLLFVVLAHAHAVVSAAAPSTAPPQLAEPVGPALLVPILE